MKSVHKRTDFIENLKKKTFTDVVQGENMIAKHSQDL